MSATSSVTASLRDLLPFDQRTSTLRLAGSTSPTPSLRTSQVRSPQECISPNMHLASHAIGDGGS